MQGLMGGVSSSEYKKARIDHMEREREREGGVFREELISVSKESHLHVIKMQPMSQGQYGQKR